MKKSKLSILLVCVLMSIVLLGCGHKYTTVADDITESEEEEFFEIQKFSLKNTKGVDRENIGYCAVLIPIDFVKKDGCEGMYVSTLYPLDSSNIYYTISDAYNDGYIDENLTAQNYEQIMESAFRADDDPTDIEIDKFETIDMSGIPCFKIRSHYVVDGQVIQQLTYIVMASQTHTITYTQVSDDELMVDFINDEGEIKLVRERSHA